jgi:subtilisin family serine protease
MKNLVRLIGILAIVFTLITPAPAIAQQGGSGQGLSKYDRQLLNEAIMNGETSVTLMIASQPGKNRSVAAQISRVGGSIQYREDDISYIRALVPTAEVAALASFPDIASLDIDTIIPIEDPRPEPDGGLGVIPQPAPGAGTPNNNPYMPIADIGASQFLAANPTWDGRGTVIGIVDTGVSLDHPSLLTTSTGQRKVIDWVTGTNPFTDNDPTWVNMAALVRGPVFTFNGVSYTAPAKKEYRIGLFNERDPRLGGEIGSDVNRDGNPAGSSGIFAVLWDTKTNDVYVDVNQNQNFTDDMAMTDYRVRYDVNWFGVDNPATPVAERMPFVVQTDGKNKVVNIGIVSGAHGSHVAGIAAGHSLFGGAMSGAAPGAQIVSLRACLFVAGCTAHALFEGMIFVAKQSSVDVINMSIGGLPALNDGNNTRAMLYDRLIGTYKVQMFISAGNSGPGINTVGDPSVASLVMSVGAYVSAATLLADYGTNNPFADNLHYFSSRGPREDGGFKPQIVASGAAISTIPLWQPGGGLASVLPPGYALFNGTSMAAPQAAGGAALLISAAKQSGAQSQPDQIRQAMNSTARYLDPSRFQPFDQGNGLLNVVAAWDVLKTNAKTVSINASVPVNTLLSDFLANPGYGVGIHDREGVAAGDSYVRTYTFVRTSGGGGTVSYNLSWVGNDGTFSTASSLALPLNTPVTLDVHINPATSGVHSAILNLDDPSNPGIEFQTMNTVFAADQFTAANSYTVTKIDSVAPMNAHNYSFNVPPGTPAFKVDFSGPSTTPGTGMARFLRWHPWGLGIDSNAVSNCYLPNAGAGCSTGSAASRTTANPQAGVWEVSVDARRNSDTPFTPYTLTASILGASVSPNPDVITSTMVGVPTARSYELTSVYAPFTGRAVGSGSLGSANVGVYSIAHHAQEVFFVSVVPGSTSLRATIGSPSDPAADLDLFVFNCTSGTCVQAGSNADGDSEESVTINNPTPGLWAVMVDGYSVPAGTTTFNYVDVFLNPGFGTFSIADADALRPTGATWTVPGTVTANAAPAAGRVLLGNVLVRTIDGFLVGSGDVIVQNVVSP